MKSIEEYIEAAKSMENTSDGGSPAYHFEDVVLVKYSMTTKYGQARKNEEQIAEAANRKRMKGIRTPYHYAIKRVEEGDINICWVLQERAKGESFTHYSAYKNDSKTQLIRQEELSIAPDSYYERCVLDLSELRHMGLELKDKNIFYDKDSGFTFIDLIGYDETPLDSNSLKEVLWLSNAMCFIYGPTTIGFYDKGTEEEKQKSKELSYELKKKIFIAMEKVIPNFEQYRRWVLRDYSSDELDYFKSHGVEVGDLSLTEKEYQFFRDLINMIVDDSMKKIETGKCKFWEIGTNEIRINLSNWGLNKAWLYHRANKKSKEDFESEYNYIHACEKDLEELVKNMFYEKLDAIPKNDACATILKAKEDLEKERERVERMKSVK